MTRGHTLPLYLPGHHPCRFCFHSSAEWEVSSFCSPEALSILWVYHLLKGTHFSSRIISLSFFGSFLLFEENKHATVYFDRIKWAASHSPNCWRFSSSCLSLWVQFCSCFTFLPCCFDTIQREHRGCTNISVHRDSSDSCSAPFSSQLDHFHLINFKRLQCLNICHLM